MLLLLPLLQGLLLQVRLLFEVDIPFVSII